MTSVGFSCCHLVLLLSPLPPLPLLPLPLLWLPLRSLSILLRLQPPLFLPLVCISWLSTVPLRCIWFLVLVFAPSEVAAPPLLAALLLDPHSELVPVPMSLTA